jgi:flagellar hook-associated protein 1 FlgK
MSKIHGMMDVGKRSMMNSQTALQTVGHNIANKGTEGYSRQRVDIQASEAIGTGQLRVGTGAKAASISRINNPYLEKQIGKEQAGLGYYQGKADAMTRVEQVYNEQVNKGLNTFISDFFNSVREFSNNPESLATRTQVLESASALTKDFRRVSNQLTEIQRDIDQQIATNVTEINSMTREIATLNEKIKMIQTSGGPANDERDRRDLLIKNLGEKINIRWAEGTDGMVTVSAGNSALLVAGYDAKELLAQPTPETDTKGEANLDIFYKSNDRAEPIIVTGQITGGAIGGLLQVRDETIHGLLNDTDHMAYSLTRSVNAVHRRGFDVYNRPGGEFFAVPEQIRHCAANIDVSADVRNDVGRIVAAGQSSSPGDNRVANAMHELQFEKLVDDQTATLDEYYNSAVGKVGIQARQAESSATSQKDIIKQLSNIRESISGVSLDEETTKLIEFQKAFDASARLIRTADEMFDTVLSLKHM